MPTGEESSAMNAIDAIRNALSFGGHNIRHLALWPSIPLGP
jgi:hypothetical protein